MQPLHPFEPLPWLQGTQLSGEAQWQGGELQVLFALQAPDHAVLRPAGAGQLQRRDGLWHNTCFEAFVGAPGQEGYWEINLSPNGDWNVYALSAYRQNLTPVAEISALPYSLRADEGQLQIGFQLDFGQLLNPSEPIELSLTAVLHHPEHGMSFWAWQHGAAEADFHHRASFQLLQPSA